MLATVSSGVVFHVVYTAGVLHELGRLGVKLPLHYTASGSSLPSTYAVAGEYEALRERALTILQDPSFINPLRVSNIMNTNYLTNLIRLDIPVYALQNGSENRVAARHETTGEVNWFSSHNEEYWDALQATISIPYLTPGFSQVLNARYADPAIAATWPHSLKQALADKADRVLVINPVNPDDQELGIYRLAYRAWLSRRSTAFQEAYWTDFTMNSPKPGPEVTLHFIQPAFPLRVSIFRPASLRTAFNQGVTDVQEDEGLEAFLA